MAKTKMSDDKKLILIYSVELGVFSIVFLVLGILKVIGVINSEPNVKTLIFNIITSAGGIWIISDFIWALASKKRRPKVCLLDKALILPLAIWLITFDIICFVNYQAMPLDWYKIGISCVFFYVTVIYAFQAIYHYKHPVPMVLEEIRKMHEEEEKEKLLEAQKQESESKEKSE